MIDDVYVGVVIMKWIGGCGWVVMMILVFGLYLVILILESFVVSECNVV